MFNVLHTKNTMKMHQRGKEARPNPSRNELPHHSGFHCRTVEQSLLGPDIAYLGCSIQAATVCLSKIERHIFRISVCPVNNCVCHHLSKYDSPTLGFRCGGPCRLVSLMFNVVDESFVRTWTPIKLYTGQNSML